MKNRLVRTLFVLGTVMCLGLSGCSGMVGDSGRDTEIEDEDGDDEEDDDDDRDRDDRDDDGDDDENDEDPGNSELQVSENGVVSIDYNSEQSILSFAEGTWYLTDMRSGESYGELLVSKDGKCRFKYIPTGARCDGTIEFNEGYDSSMSGLHYYEMEFTGLQNAFGCWEDTSSTSGRFRITQSEGKDFLYIEEIGNGGSFIAYDVFCLPAVEDFDLDMRWIFTRDNNVKGTGDVTKNSEFYAVAVETGDAGILLQTVEAVEKEALSEYTAFKFMSAVFDESEHQDAQWYSVSSNADMSGILHESNLDAVYPNLVYEVKTDSDGKVTSLKEVERAFYGEYELYPLAQEVEFSGTSFTINGYTHELNDYAITGDKIMDCTTFGDYLIVEAHVNPHMGSYTLFNMRSGWPEKVIYGCNYIFGDKVWDSFYSYMDTVYDYEDHVVYTVDGAEICGLSIIDDELHIEYWKDDYDEVYEAVIDRPECLNAPNYAFADYRHHSNVNTWNEFLNYVPEGAAAMIMVNPHSDDTWDYYQPYPVDYAEYGYGDDTIYVVSLYDGSEVYLERKASEILDKGEITAYSATVPEGVPTHTIIVDTPDGRESEWPISIISGKDDIRWTFIGD